MTHARVNNRFRYRTGFPGSGARPVPRGSPGRVCPVGSNAGSPRLELGLSPGTLRAEAGPGPSGLGPSRPVQPSSPV